MLKEVRIQAGMTLKQVSELTGIPIRSIQNWEAGTRKCPEYLERLVVEKIVSETKVAKVIRTPDGCAAIAIVNTDGSWYHDIKVPINDGRISEDFLHRINELQKSGYKIIFNL